MSDTNPGSPPTRPVPPPPPPPRPEDRTGAGAGHRTGVGAADQPGPTPSGWGQGGPVTIHSGEHLPRPGLDDRERELAPAVVTSWRISAALGWLLPAAVTIGLGFVFGDSWGWLVLVAISVLVLFSVVVYPRMRYRRWRWQLTDLAIELRYGVLVRIQETVPYFRIQQIDIAAGPVDRLLELASLQVTSASASGSASLPGIAAEDAPRVRAELLARAAAAVADHPGDLRDAV